MTPPAIPNPDSWMDVLTILAVTAMVAIPSVLTHRQSRVVKEVREQVKNQHSTNLRDDLDRAIAAIALIGEEVRHFGEEVRQLRKDLMAAEEHRRVQISGLYDELEHRTGKGRGA